MGVGGGLAEKWTTPPCFPVESNAKTKIPIAGKENILITSALPYVNNVPHLGTIIGCVLSGDVFNRFCRLKNYQSLHICGTDEYGTATERKAFEEGTSPQAICDKYHRLHAEIYAWFNIEFDHFGRTSTEHQTELCQDIFRRLKRNNYTSTSVVDQLFCLQCNRFLADRFVEGTCPQCGYADARGDQCDGCSQLINAVELREPRCNICKSTPVVRSSEHIFIDLDRLSPKVLAHVDRVTGAADCRWSSNAVAIARSWLNRGLERRCITRDLKWGVPVPDFPDKVFYVWYDAPIGYISITKALLGDAWKLWWKNDDQVQLYHFVGKDNVAFHSVMFPATLLGADDGYTLVRHISATEYLNYENTKFSKSRGTGVFGDDAKNTGIPADVWRFYLLYMRPETQDTAFSWDDFALKVNSELLSNLGNFVNRALSFLHSQLNACVPAMTLEAADEEFLAAIQVEMTEYDTAMRGVHLREGLTRILAISRRGNQYLQMHQPWKLVKGDEHERRRAETVIGVAANVAYLLAVLLHPFMPVTSATIRDQCNSHALPLLPPHPICFLPAGHCIGQPAPLFAKIEKAVVEQLKERFQGRQQSATPTAPSKEPSLAATVKNGEAVTVTGSKKKKQGEKKETAMIGKYPRLMAQSNAITKLLAEAEAKFARRKDEFVLETCSRLAREKEALIGEVARLQAALVNAETVGGVTQIAVPAKQKEMSKCASQVDGSIPPTAAPPVVASAAVKETSKKEKKVPAGNAEAKGNDEDTVDVGRLDLRVGLIVKAEKHPDADTLYVEQVDLGEAQPRTVVSGLVRHIPIEQMQNRLAVLLCNLKPAKMRGVESQAMVMCASTPDKVEILEVPSGSKPGDLVTCSGFAHRPDAVLNPKKKIWEQVAPELAVTATGEAAYRGVPLTVGQRGAVRAATLRGVPIK